jgi:FkbM family methyltransferase
MKGLLTSIADGTRRLAYQSKVRRMTRRFHHWSSDDQTRLEFYGQMISAESLVFDVGANVGNRTKVFAKLGATVIAVEPQPSCADFLESVFSGNRRVHLVREALGAKRGEADMMIAESTTLSTLSTEWVEAMTHSGRFEGTRWNKKQRVQVNTLDRLIEVYGVPDFVKVDVEGFEEQVVAGLSQPVGIISLEITPEFLDKTNRCIDRFLSIAPCAFQVSFGESMSFSLPEWCKEHEVRMAMSRMKAGEFGDLYVRFERT